MHRPLLFTAVVLSLMSCNVALESPRQAPPAARPIAPLDPTGEAATLSPETDANLQWAAAVTEVHPLTGADGKLFGVAGGDPAMNGLYTYVAFFEGPAEGWRVFRIGDFLSFRVLREAPGRVDLEVEESTMDEASGRIGSRKRRLIVGFVPGADGAPPAAVTVTPAR